MISRSSPPAETTVLVAGIGLIGGSLAAAVRARKLANRVIGWGRNAEKLQRAVDLGLLDDFILSPEAAPAETTFAIVCTPVTRIIEDVRQLAQHLRADCLITDAGSTKFRICSALADLPENGPTFIGSHPIAGSEKQGCEFADSGLLEGKTCVITPLPSHAPEAVARVEQFWQGLGMRTQQLSPAEHDRALARTSHVPHVVAAALAGAVSASDLPWTGSGFRDTTRIAAGDPQLWTGILQENAAEVLAGIAEVQQRLHAFSTALQASDPSGLLRELELGKQIRDQLQRPAAVSFEEE